LPVLSRSKLEASRLADLHALASELSLDGYRRLRKQDLIDALIAHQGGQAVEEDPVESTEATDAEITETASTETAGSSRHRGGRGRGGARRAASAEAEPVADKAEPVADKAEPVADKAEPVADEAEPVVEETEAAAAEETVSESPRARRGSRGGRGRSSARREATESEAGADDDAAEAKATPQREEAEIVTGTVELLPGGSGFVRVTPPEPSDDDVYISAPQVKRCELISGDVVSGPRRPPHRSERYASLVRVDTVNGTPAEEISGGARFDDLPAEFPKARFKLGAGTPILKAIDTIAPIGFGSRVTIAGQSFAGKSSTLLAIAQALQAVKDLTVLTALVGIRPEEAGEWTAAGVTPQAAVSFAASTEAQDHAAELVIEQGKRLASRGGNAVVLIDTLDGLSPLAARRALASARKLTDGGSLTVIVTGAEPFGGETTVIALDREQTLLAQAAMLDVSASATLHAELMVTKAAFTAIARERGKATGVTVTADEVIPKPRTGAKAAEATAEVSPKPRTRAKAAAAAKPSPRSRAKATATKADVTGADAQ
jgi:transcription termination factor Rho